MLYFRNSRLLRSLLLPLTLVLWTSACHNWVQPKSPYDQSITRDRPSEMRTGQADSLAVTLLEPRAVAIEDFDIATVGSRTFEEPRSSQSWIAWTAIAGLIGLAWAATSVEESVDF